MTGHTTGADRSDHDCRQSSLRSRPPSTIVTVPTVRSEPQSERAVSMLNKKDRRFSATPMPARAFAGGVCRRHAESAVADGATCHPGLLCIQTVSRLWLFSVFSAGRKAGS